MSTMQPPSPEERWTMPPQPPPGGTAAASPPPSPPPAGPARRPGRLRGPAATVAIVLAGLLVGGGVMYALDHRAGAAAAGTGIPAVAVPGPNGLGGGAAPGGAGIPGGPGGPLAGEQHVQGTVTAKTATTVTVKSSAGTATYTVDASSQIVRNGQAATLAAVKVGDPVLVHVYPSSSGRLTVERLFATGSASGGLTT